VFLAIVKPSVYLFVCLSVCPFIICVNCDKTTAPGEQRTLPLSPPKGSQKRKVTVFCLKKLFSKKVRYKVSLYENFHQQSCKAFTGLFNRAQMVVGVLPFCLKFLAKVTFKGATSN